MPIWVVWHARRRGFPKGFITKRVLETVVGHDSSMKEIMRQKQELKDERDALVKECDEHRAELEKNTERIISVSTPP